MANDRSGGQGAGVWWQRGVIYQIYPRSFQDSDGDGIGDLNGIAARLDHLVALGVDAIWISPFYPSPMADFGYDVADHCDVDPIFGTLDDFDRLLDAAHARGLKLILDFVPNHTSDRHPWFIESRRSRDGPRRDWYVWRDPAPDPGPDSAPGGGPPNNWLSEFGGPAWTLDRATGQYWYHAYLPEQPDLNWRNPGVRAAMLDVLRFWFRRGVDGFRVDAIHHLFKDEALRDNPPNPDYRTGMSPRRRLIRQHTTDLPEVQGAVREMRALVSSYGDRVLIGEAWLPFDRLIAYYGESLDCFHLPFNFHLIGARWEAGALRRVIAEYEALLPAGAWPNWVLGNHDRSRLASRVGAAQARVAAVLLCTLRGTPTLYYGDELGMADVPGRHDEEILRNVDVAEISEDSSPREPSDGVLGALDRTPQRMSGIEVRREQVVDELLGSVLDHADLLHDDLALALELLGVEQRSQHDVRQELHGIR